MIGTVETSEWITVAADIDGKPQPGELGKIRTERYARFAWRAEAETWLTEQQQAGYDGTIASAAVAWFGKTDAPGNCWSVTVSKITGTVIRQP